MTLALGTSAAGVGAVYAMFQDEVTRNILVASGSALLVTWTSIILASILKWER